MTDYISQQEVDILRDMPKEYLGETLFDLPDFGGGKLVIPLFSENKREEFKLDITASTIALKRTYQNRARINIVLVRVDLNGPPHRNPDGEEILCPHIHIYKEGYGDKWAYVLPDMFTNHNDAFVVLLDFMRFCNITKPPQINKGLFV